MGLLSAIRFVGSAAAAAATCFLKKDKDVVGSFQSGVSYLAAGVLCNSLVKSPIRISLPNLRRHAASNLSPVRTMAAEGQESHCSPDEKTLFPGVWETLSLCENLELKTDYSVVIGLSSLLQSLSSIWIVVALSTGRQMSKSISDYKILPRSTVVLSPLQKFLFKISNSRKRNQPVDISTRLSHKLATEDNTNFEALTVCSKKQERVDGFSSAVTYSSPEHESSPTRSDPLPRDFIPEVQQPLTTSTLFQLEAATPSVANSEATPVNLGEYYSAIIPAQDMVSCTKKAGDLKVKEAERKPLASILKKDISHCYWPCDREAMARMTPKKTVTFKEDLYKVFGEENHVPTKMRFPVNYDPEKEDWPPFVVYNMHRRGWLLYESMYYYPMYLLNDFEFEHKRREAPAMKTRQNAPSTRQLLGEEAPHMNCVDSDVLVGIEEDKFLAEMDRKLKAMAVKEMEENGGDEFWLLRPLSRLEFVRKVDCLDSFKPRLHCKKPKKKLDPYVPMAK